MSEAVVLKNNQTWIICGGRHFDNQILFDRAMKDIVTMKGMPSKIVQGGASGVDEMAKKFAQQHGLEMVEVRADWSKGSMAGPIRNRKMAEDHKPHLVIAFPGGRGTSSMKQVAVEKGIDLLMVELGEGFAKY